MQLSFPPTLGRPPGQSCYMKAYMYLEADDEAREDEVPVVDSYGDPVGLSCRQADIGP